MPIVVFLNKALAVFFAALALVVVGSSAKAVPAIDSPSVALPGGRMHVFGNNEFLVAYYGAPGTGALGVLGRSTPQKMTRHLAKAAAAFASTKRPVQPVYEVIVSVADAGPGKHGSYSHNVSRDSVKRYIRLAHEHGALVILDIQPGRVNFLRRAKQWAWALKDPWVGLALDPEWRMGRHEVPGRVIGHVDAKEINEVSAWLSHLVTTNGLPEKLFLLHTFRRSMIPDIAKVERRDGLAMVLHVDGFGTPGDKLATYRTVARPKQFTMGFKLFYRADTHLMKPRQVLKIHPTVRFVSYQ